VALLSHNSAFLTVKADVTDIAWSPGDRYLASVGLDSAVMIWCGFTLGEVWFTFALAPTLILLQNAYENWINTKVSSRVCVGTL